MTQEHMSAAEYRKTAGKPSKYRNVKTVVDGRVFHSLKEANHYCKLKLLKQSGEITDFFCQVPFVVHDGYYKDGKWVAPIIYKADFMVMTIAVVVNKNAITEVRKIIQIHETKGKWTREAINKRKMFEARYPEYEMVII